jgi:hypothetical protein
MEQLLTQINELENICGVTPNTKLPDLEKSPRNEAKGYYYWLTKQCPNHFCFGNFEEMWPES